MKYGALRLMGSLSKFVAVLILIAGVALGVVILTGAAEDSKLFADLTVDLTDIHGALSIAGGVVGFLLLYAGGESIYLFIDIEENTRRMAERSAGKKES